MMKDFPKKHGPVFLPARPRPEQCGNLLLLLVAATFGCAPVPQPSGERREAQKTPQASETAETGYAIWDQLELDRCASAWLIKRFVDPHARFLVYPEGTLDVQGIPVDMPTSPYRRTQRQAVFEVLLDKHGLDDPALKELARQVHAVEIDYWLAPRDAAAQTLNERLLATVQKPASPQDALEQSFLLFDEVLLQIRRKHVPEPPPDGRQSPRDEGKA